MREKGDGRGTATKRQIYGGEGAEEMGERQMGDKAKWIQLLQTDFDKWHSDRETAEMHTLVQTHTLYHAGTITKGINDQVTKWFKSKVKFSQSSEADSSGE